MINPQHLPMAIKLGALPHAQIFWGWIALCATLSLHVTDEACTGFLSVYNSTVMALRKGRPWLPIPVYTFGPWLAGLIVANVILFCLSVFVLRGAHWMRPICYAFAVIMFANAWVHILGTVFGRTVASIRFPRPMPGFYTSPLMLLASTYLLWAL